MSESIKKIGARLTLEGASEFASSLKRSASSIKDMGNSLKQTVQNLGASSSAMQMYQAKMKSLEVQAKYSKTVIDDLRKKQLDYSKSLETIPGKIDTLSKKLNEQRTISDNAKKAIDEQEKIIKKLGKTYKSGSDEIKDAKGRLKELNNEYKSSKKSADLLEQEIKTLNTAFSNHESTLKRLPNSIERAEANYDKLRAQIRQTNEEFRNSGGRFSDTANRFSNFGNRMTNAGEKLSNFGQSLTIATAGLSFGMKYATDRAMEFETGMAGINKTVDATPEQMSNIRNELLNMSTKIPVTATELAKIGEVVGQLGVRANDIVPFTETIANLGATTNLSSEEAATSLAQFMNVMNIGKENISNLGSTVVELGNNFATNERAIVEMGQRLSGMGQLTKMSGADVMGLATAMSSLGIEAEAGGSAMTQSMTKMQNAVLNGGEDLEAFASAAGVSSETFANAFRNRPVEALQMVLRGLKNVDESGGNVNAVLESLGITGIREADAMKRLSGALDGESGLASAIETANRAWKENNALSKEASTKYETTASKVQVAKNEINKMAIEIGSTFLPKIAEALKQGKPLIDVLGDIALAFAKLPPAMQLGILGAGPIIGFLGNLTSIIGGTSSAIGGLVRWFGRLTTGKVVAELGKAASASTVAGKAISDIGGKAAAAGSMAPLLSNPYVAAGVAITAAVAGLGYMIYREMTKDSRNHEESVKKTEGVYKEWFDAVKEGAETSGASLEELSNKANKSSEEVKKMLDDIKKTNTEITETLDDEINGRGIFGGGSLKGRLKDKYMLSDEDVSEVVANMEKVGISLGNSLSSITGGYAQFEKITSEFASAQITVVKNMSSEISSAFEKRRDAEIKSIETMKSNGSIEEAEYNKRVSMVKEKYNTISNEIQSAQDTISNILNTAAKENRRLTSSELEQLQLAYDKYMKLSSESVTTNVEAQKDIYSSLNATINDGQLKALQSAGILTDAQTKAIMALGTTKQKQDALNQALDEFASKDPTQTVTIEYNGDNIVLSFTDNFERVRNLPNIVKTIKIAEAEGRTIEMTKADLEFLNKQGIAPKNVKIVDGISGLLPGIQGNINNFINAPSKKSIMLQDDFSSKIDNIMEKATKYNSVQLGNKSANVTDNASSNINTAKTSVENYNATNPNHKTLSASGNASPFTQDAKNNLDTFIGTNPAGKILSASGNASPFTQNATRDLNVFQSVNPGTKQINASGNASSVANEATRAINGVPSYRRSVIDVVTNKITNFFSNMFGAHATGGHIDAYATGGHIDMFATGGNIGNTQWLNRGYQGIVGEAGPELFTVGRSGVNITPLSTREKIRGISGALEENNSKGISVVFNMNGITVREEADIEKISASIERRFVRAMKEAKLGKGGSNNVYSL